MRERRANFEVMADVAGKPLVIRDVGPWDQFPTVTNAAEAVIEELTRKGLLSGGRRLLYFDSEGSLDEILISSDGHFQGFQVAQHGGAEQ
jgi:hypothetical protein